MAEPGALPPEGTRGAQDGELTDARRRRRLVVALMEPARELLGRTRLVEHGQRGVGAQAVLQCAERAGVDPP